MKIWADTRRSNRREVGKRKTERRKTERRKTDRRKGKRCNLEKTQKNKAVEEIIEQEKVLLKPSKRDEEPKPKKLEGGTTKTNTDKAYSD